ASSKKGWRPRNTLPVPFAAGMSCVCSPLIVSSSASIRRSLSRQDLQYAIEGLSEVFLQGIAKDVFKTPVRFAGLVVFAPACGEAKTFPVGGLIAGAGKSSLGIDEGLQPDDPMGINAFPIGGYPPGHL